MITNTLLLAFSINTLIIPIAVFACVAAVAWMMLDKFSNKDDRTDRRLDILHQTRVGGRKDGRDGKKKEAFARLLEKATPTLSKPLQPKTEKEMSRLKQRLVEAGFRHESAPSVFLSVKVMVALVVLFFTGGILLFLSGFSIGNMIKFVIAAGIGFYLPELILSFFGHSRKKQIFLGLPDALDLMVVCVEAGLGLDQAMRKVAEEMKKSYRILADEFGMSNLHLQMGRERNVVLQNLGDRTGVDDLRSLASLLIQADKFGSSVAQALRVQSDAMRVKRQQIAEEKAAKTAVKLIFPLVVFIFPGVFVVLVGPAAIQMVREMFPAMQGG
jgi:tight adherence protein C